MAISDVDIMFLKDQLRYDPDSGKMFWTRGQRAGREAGCVRRDGYRMVRLNYVLYYVHRLAYLYMTGKTPRGVDHKNGNPADNRWCNLREASQDKNCANSADTRGRDLPKGVVKTRNGKFTARITPWGMVKHLGTFETVEDAKQAYDEAALKEWGEFASVNRERAS